MTHGEPELLAGAYRSSLLLADELGATERRLPGHQHGHLRLSAARRRAGRDQHAWPSTCVASTGVEVARFVLFSEETYERFAGALAELAAAQ